MSPSSEEVLYVGRDESFTGLRDGTHLEGSLTSDEMSSLERVAAQARWATYAAESLSEDIRIDEAATSLRVVIRGNDGSRQVVWSTPGARGLSDTMLDLITVATEILNAK